MGFGAGALVGAGCVVISGVPAGTVFASLWARLTLPRR